MRPGPPAKRGFQVDLGRYGPWAVVAGGSGGLGACCADRLAAQGCNLVLIGRKVEPLDAAADRARDAGVDVRALSLDLTAGDATDRVRQVTDDVDVGLLIYNAGANAY